MKEKENRKKFTKEFKSDAINLMLEQGYSCSEVERRLGVHSSNISRWVRGFRHDQEDIVGGGISRHELEEENRRLRKENKRVEMEHEILKKAATFFVKELS